MVMPFFVQVYAIAEGFAFACSGTCNDSPSNPTEVHEGGGTNLGRTANEICIGIPIQFEFEIGFGFRILGVSQTVSNCAIN